MKILGGGQHVESHEGVRAHWRARPVGVHSRPNHRLRHALARVDPACAGIGDRQGRPGQLEAPGARHRLRRRRHHPSIGQLEEGRLLDPGRRRKRRRVPRPRNLQGQAAEEPAHRYYAVRVPDGVLGAQGLEHPVAGGPERQARARRVGAADRRRAAHHRGARRRRPQVRRRDEGPGHQRRARRGHVQGRQARHPVLRRRRAEGAGSRRLGWRPAGIADEPPARFREAHEGGAAGVLLLDGEPGAAHRRLRQAFAGADDRCGDRRRRARARRRRDPVRKGDAGEQEGARCGPSQLLPLRRDRGGQGTADLAAPSGRDQILQGSRNLEGVAPGASRVGQGALAALLIAGSIAWSLDLFRPLGLVLFNEQFAAAAFGIGLALTFLRFRFRKTHVEESGYSGTTTAVPWYDVVLTALSLALLGYVAVWYPTLTAMAGTVDAETMTLAIGITALTIEATRRTIGWSLVIILLVLAGYVLIGHLVPGQLQTRKVEVGQMLGYLNLDNNGLLGIVLQITVIVIIPFVLMGQLLMRSGGSNFFNDAAIALMGRYGGGAAKMAVVGSSLFGMISGIAAANTVAVGIVTIPLMKRSGMSARLAAAVEACASNGGQLMPPVMGAVAFVMADFLQIPYKEVAIAAILPSVMYYSALFIQADLEAARYGFGKVEESKIPRLLKVLAAGWMFLVPFVVLVYTMFWLNLEPEYCAMAAAAAIVVLGFAVGYAGQRMRVRDLWHAVVETAGGLCEILVISAAAGFIMGLFQVSGLAFAFAAYLVDLGGQSLILLLMLAAVVSIILGMGLPTIGVYVMLAVLVAPALVKVGVDPLAAHLFILYFGMMSLITPPVAPAAYVAAAIAQAPSMATAWTAMRFGWSSYIVPFLFVYSPAILIQGSVVDIVAVTVTSLFGIWLICAAMTGYSTRVMKWEMRLAFAAAGIMLLMPHQASDTMLWINIAGALAGIALIAWELRGRKAYSGSAILP